MDARQRRERNEQTVQRGIEQLSKRGALGFVDDQFASDFVLHETSRPDDVRGSEGFKAYVGLIRTAYPDLEIEVLDLVAEVETVAVRYAWRGTHEGEFLGIDPTGITVEGSGMAFVRFEDGKCTEAWVVEDLLGLFDRLGAVDSPARQPTADPPRIGARTRHDDELDARGNSRGSP